MRKFVLKDTLLNGFLLGITSIVGLYFLLSGLDIIALHTIGRCLFIKPDAKQLVILTTLIIAFRQQIKKDEMEKGKGLFLALFISAMLYMVQKKTNFATW